jgi:hypothetical protein
MQLYSEHAAGARRFAQGARTSPVAPLDQAPIAGVA